STCFIPRPSPSQAQGFQLPDFYSGATDQLGCFTEGFLLRRLQTSQPDAREGQAGLLGVAEGSVLYR
ncbi:MAG: hypothetical protein WB822_13115, partial [Rhodoplanes sp.]